MPIESPQAIVRNKYTFGQMLEKLFTEVNIDGNPALVIPTVQVNTRSKQVTCGPGGDVSLIVSTAAYDAGDCVGGLIEIPLGTKAGESGIVQSVIVQDRGLVGTAFDIVFYNQIPDTGEYDFVDQAPFGGTNVLGFKVEQMAGFVSIAATDWKTKGQANVVQANFSPFVFQLRPSVTSLYMAIHSVGAPTFSINTNLSVQVGLLID